MPVQARPLDISERDAAIAYLATDAKSNLFLLDLTARLGQPPAPGELATEILCAWKRDRIAGIATLRPSVAFDSDVSPEALEAFKPYLEMLGVGLVKSAAPAVDAMWPHLSAGGRRRAIVDRLETAYALRAHEARLPSPGPDCAPRAATAEDLEPLVVAARESLREEGRPDPFSGDLRGFRRWVRGRVHRARVVERGGRIVFVGYADVRRKEGWLLQGIYTWPDARRLGYGRVGTSDLCRSAFASGAEHVQLAVVDGNDPARALYESIGFKPFGRLRTVLFA